MVELSSPQLDRLFTALGQPTRRALLSELARGERTVSELARPFDLSLAAVSKHIKVLEQADLVTQRRAGRTRVCRLNPEPLAQAAGVIESYRRFWEESLDSLERLLG